MRRLSGGPHHENIGPGSFPGREGGKKLTFAIDTRKTVLVLCAITALLIVADLIGLYSKYYLGHPRVFGLVPLFDLDREQTVPALFSTCLLLLNSLLFLLAWKASRKMMETEIMFLILSVLFCYLAIDEFCELHEYLTIPIQKRFPMTGIFLWSWVIPFGIGVLILSIAMFPVLWRMEGEPRFWFFLSAATYVSGAIGGDMLAGWYLTKKGLLKWGEWGNDFGYQLFVLYEESFEMAGLIMLSYALLSLLGIRYGGLSILVADSRGGDPSAE